MRRMKWSRSVSRSRGWRVERLPSRAARALRAGTSRLLMKWQGSRGRISLNRKRHPDQAGMAFIHSAGAEVGI